MSDASQNDRIINGLLKAEIGLLTPEQVREHLSQDVLICADPSRVSSSDLWPCVWFLAAVLEREFYGKVYLRVGHGEGLPMPTPLSSRCVFVDNDFEHTGLEVGIGVAVASGIWGDARGQNISYQTTVPTADPATPMSGCALAGYLGFAALADAAGVPPFHQAWSQDMLALPAIDRISRPLPPIAILGNGHIGQAFLALGYFMYREQRITAHLVDKDSFEDDNYRSQLLLNDDCRDWVGRDKATVLRETCEAWGWDVTESHRTIRGDWQSPLSPCAIAFLGFDNMEARRICAQGNFSRIVECGVGADFLRPRISWHSLPSSRPLAHRFFPDPEPRETEARTQTSFLQGLDKTPGACGRLRFEDINAAAPCMGAVAAAFAWMELQRFLSGDLATIDGAAFLWSPLQPYQRDSKDVEALDITQEKWAKHPVLKSRDEEVD